MQSLNHVQCKTEKYELTLDTGLETLRNPVGAVPVAAFEFPLTF